MCDAVLHAQHSYPSDLSSHFLYEKEGFAGNISTLWRIQISPNSVFLLDRNTASSLRSSPMRAG